MQNQVVSQLFFCIRCVCVRVHVQFMCIWCVCVCACVCVCVYTNEMNKLMTKLVKAIKKKKEFKEQPKIKYVRL